LKNKSNSDDDENRSQQISESTQNKQNSEDGLDRSNYMLSDAEKNSKNLNEFANIRTSIELNKKLKSQFIGK
jgi:hypothetical protein